MARPSTIANHPDRQKIEEALAGNEPLRRISARFEVSVTALHRHRHALATRCTTPSEIPSPIPSQVPAAPSPQSPAGFSRAPDPFDLTSARYPWAEGETPRPDPLAERLRVEQRQSGTNGVRSAVLGMIGQYQAAGLTDETLARKLDVEPWRIAAWRTAEEREQIARLSRDPQNLIARELAAIEQRERRANHRLLNPAISERAEASCNATLNQCARQKIALLQAAGVRLALPPHEPQDHRTTLADMLKAGAADVMLTAPSVRPDMTLDDGIEAFKDDLEHAWAALDGEPEAEPEDTNPPSK